MAGGSIDEVQQLGEGTRWLSGGWCFCFCMVVVFFGVGSLSEDKRRCLFSVVSFLMFAFNVLLIYGVVWLS